MISNSEQPTRIHDRLEELIQENARLIAEKEDLITDLEEYRFELFKRVPKNQVSDCDLRDVFENIHQSIDDFVFDIMSDVDDNGALYKYCQRVQSPRQTSRKRDCLTQFHNFIRNQDVDAWGPFESSNLYILSVIIQWTLDEYIFKKSHPLGITAKHVQFVSEVEVAMRHTGQNHHA